MTLSAIIFTPLIFGALLCLFKSDKSIKVSTLIFSILHFLLCLFMLSSFDKATVDIQMAEKIAWLPSMGISYFVGIDGLSVWLVMLTSFLLPLVILGSWNSIATKTKAFHLCLLGLQTTMIGTFLALDAILFYTFFELSLIPMYFLIGIWGGKNKLYAAMKFFIYTMAGSVFMLLGIISLIFMTKSSGGVDGQMSASILDFYALDIPFVAGAYFSTQTLLFFGFCLAFAIKVPLFPLHTWLPDAHVQAPTPGSVILAGVMLKMGTYGFLRLVLPVFPEAAEYWSWLFMYLGVMGIIYGALVAMVQTDIKKLVAYSSVSHMGYVVIGIFSLNTFGLTGSLYQMLCHGISTGALFFLVGMLYDRTHSREISKYGGLAVKAPIYAIAFLIVTMSSIAVPMTNGFVGEFLILLGVFGASKMAAGFAVLGVILGAAYMLWLVKRVFFGPQGELVKDKEESFFKLTLKEKLVLAPLIFMIFWMGIFPNHFISYSEASLNHLSNNMSNYELNVVGDTAIDKASEGDSQ